MEGEGEDRGKRIGSMVKKGERERRGGMRKRGR